MEKIIPTKDAVNNDIYHHLGDDWHTSDDDPVALLRAESKLKNPWVIKTIHTELGPGPKKVLDIGCGAGLLCNALALENHRVIGIDQAENALEVGKKYDQTKSVHYQVGDAYNLPFEDESFDVVCAMDFLEHVEDPYKVICEASRVLRPGGIFLFHTFSKNLLAYLIIIKCVEWFLPKTPKNMHVLRLFISPKELKKMLHLVGLRVGCLKGMRPRFEQAAFWKSLWNRRVHQDFNFTFTNSTLLAYLGFARK